MDNPDLHDYLDFRKYLQDVYLYRKHVNQRLSYQVLALKFKLGSRSHLYDIIHGRTLTSRYLPRYLEMLSLSGQDAEYFKALVDFNQELPGSAQQDAFSRLIRYSRKLKTLDVDSDYLQLFRNWHNPILLSILEMNPHLRDHGELGKLFVPAIGAVEVRHALECLQNIGLIRWNDNENRWNFLGRFFSCTGPARAVALKEFHLQLFELGKKAYVEDPARQSFSTLTLGTNWRTKEQIDAILARTRKEILDLVKQDPHAEIAFQLNMQLFPISCEKKEIL